MSGVISTISNQDKTPGVYKQYQYNTGPNGAGSTAFTLLVVAMKTSDGTAGVENQLFNLTDDATTASLAGVKSQMRRMAKNVYPKGIRAMGLILAEPSGGAAASLTITFTGSPTGAGTYSVYLAGEQAPITIVINTTDTLTTIAARLAAAINNTDNMPFTATSAVGVVTVKAANVGTYGNQFILFHDVSGIAAGVTAAVTGGTAVNPGGGLTGYKFTGGTGVESAANAIAYVTGQKFRRIAIGTVDATNFGLWKTYIDAQEAPIADNPSHLTAACSDTSTVVTGLTMTTLNDQRFAMMYHPNSETHPGEIAASMGAERTLRGANYPCYNYDGTAVFGVAPQRSPLDVLQHPQIQTLLDSGVTPLITTPDGTVVVSRAIVTKCLNGTAPDWRCLDFADAEVPDIVGDELEDEWNNNFTDPINGNLVIQDNPDPDDPQPLPSGIGTPDMWNRDATSVLYALARGDGYPGPVLINVAENLPTTTWNPTAFCFGTAVNCVAAKLPHRLDVLIRQRAY